MASNNPPPFPPPREPLPPLPPPPEFSTPIRSQRKVEVPSAPMKPWVGKSRSEAETRAQPASVERPGLYPSEGRLVRDERDISAERDRFPDRTGRSRSRVQTAGQNEREPKAVIEDRVAFNSILRSHTQTQTESNEPRGIHREHIFHGQNNALLDNHVPSNTDINKRPRSRGRTAEHKLPQGLRPELIQKTESRLPDSARASRSRGRTDIVDPQGHREAQGPPPSSASGNSVGTVKEVDDAAAAVSKLTVADAGKQNAILQTNKMIPSSGLTVDDDPDLTEYEVVDSVRSVDTSSTAPRIYLFEPSYPNDSNKYWLRPFEDEYLTGRLMASKVLNFNVLGAGWSPIWDPGDKPDIEFGDVGIIDPESKNFKAFFNIFKSEDENKLHHFHPPKEHKTFGHAHQTFSLNHVRTLAFQSTSFEKNASKKFLPSPKYKLNIKPGDMSVIVSFPEGGMLQYVNTAAMSETEGLTYFELNAPLWYYHIFKHTGLPPRNGSVFLITGTARACVFGLLASGPLPDGSVNSVEASATFRPTGKGPLDYVWDVKSGSGHLPEMYKFCTPTLQRYNRNLVADSTTQGRKEYCAAISPSAIWLSDLWWEGHFRGLPSREASPPISPSPVSTSDDRNTRTVISTVTSKTSRLVRKLYSGQKNDPEFGKTPLVDLMVKKVKSSSSVS